MKTSDAGKSLIKEFEGCVLKVYKDSVGLDTIGIGHLIKEGESFTTITEQEALDLLAKDLAQAENCINGTGLTLNQNQFDALVSFVFNLGCGAFRRSTLLKYLQARDMDSASGEFARWDMAGGKRVPGLTRRRMAETRMFMKKEQS